MTFVALQVFWSFEYNFAGFTGPELPKHLSFKPVVIEEIVSVSNLTLISLALSFLAQTTALSLKSITQGPLSNFLHLSYTFYDIDSKFSSLN